MCQVNLIISHTSGADSGFLERGFICIKVCVCGGDGVYFVDFADLISFFLNIPWDMAFS